VEGKKRHREQREKEGEEERKGIGYTAVMF
jgi:hypothetical protein